MISAHEMVHLDGGDFLMGSESFYPEEAPVVPRHVEPFWIDAYQVTNAEFAEFARATNYVTLAERPLDLTGVEGAPVDSVPAGSLVFQQQRGPVDVSDSRIWWAYVEGADWRHPRGPDSSIDGMDAHPVVHVAYEDAEAYANWKSKELPTEAEWEFAARGGLEGKIFCWGDEMNPDGKILANTWQGEFPWKSTKPPGLDRTMPVGSFPANGYGLYDMAGNVWEWTADWYATHDNNLRELSSPCCAPQSSYDPLAPAIKVPRKVLKGGSHLCAPSYCLRFRPSARMPQMIDTGMSHIGFRCVKRT
jgi:formylglycine-generating enzyme